MTSLLFNGNHYQCRTSDTVLDTLLNAGVEIPHGCREGACQSCLMRSLDVAPPSQSQKGLKDTLQQQNFFLACCCRPEQNMTVALPDQETASITAVVLEKNRLSHDIVQLVVRCDEPFNFYAGQFVNIKRPDGLTRSYSIASTPNSANSLEFHIKRLPNGRFSTWVHEELNLGDSLVVSDAKGSCHYLPGKSEQPLLLIGTGSGLAPLIGIINDALDKGHTGPIRLYHGSREPDGLYLTDHIQKLADHHGNFVYTPCVSGDTNDDNVVKGRAHDVALASTDSLSGWRVYLCGHPEMVNQSKIQAYLKGASLSDIYADAFYIAKT